MKLSVVMSVYNGEKYLREAIESILNQTVKNFEFIIVDDGSTDNSANIIKSYKDSRIVFVQQANRGLASALNVGIRASAGKYIARMDADDISLSDRLSKQMAFLDANKDVGLVGTWAVVTTDEGCELGVVKHPVDDFSIKRKLCVTSPFFHGSIMFRRSLFDMAGPYPEEHEGLFEDFIFLKRCKAHTRMANIDEALYKFRITPTAITTLSPRQLERHRNIIKEFLKNGKLRPEDKKFLSSLRKARDNRSKFANYYLKVGITLLEHAHDHRKSRLMFLRSIMLNPTVPKVWINLIYTFFRPHYTAKCKQSWKDWIEARAQRFER